MRATSQRRRSGGRVAANLRQVGTRPLDGFSAAVLAVPEGTEDAVKCVHCRLFYKKRKNGLPVSHAPGGLRCNTARDLFPCPGVEGLSL